MLPNWSTTTLGGKPVSIYQPANRPKFGVLFLHPLSGNTLTENGVYTAELARYGIACCAPQSGQSWWADRVSSQFDGRQSQERYLLDCVLPWIRETWQLAPPAIAVAGISMGGQGAIRLGFKHPALFPVVAGVASAFDYHDLYGDGTPLDELYDSKEQCRQNTAILHINPYKAPPHIWFACDPTDVWHRGNDRLHEKLTALGVQHTAVLETEAGGHSWAYFDAMAAAMMQFVVNALEQQSRRLL